MTSSRAEFPGNLVEKQAARMFLYRHVLDAPVQGHAVTLAGTEPVPELKLLRDYVKWPAHRTWFVDNDVRNRKVVAAIRRINKEWPTANTRLEDLRKVVPHLGAIGFANLDFMGWPLQKDNWECFEEVAIRLLPGAVLGFTWLRGREHFEVGCAKLLWKLGKGYQGNDRRWAGFLKAVELSTNGGLELIDRWQYYSNRSPMSVAVFRKRLR